MVPQHPRTSPHPPISAPMPRCWCWFWQKPLISVVCDNRWEWGLTEGETSIKHGHSASRGTLCISFSDPWGWVGGGWRLADWEVMWQFWVSRNSNLPLSVGYFKKNPGVTLLDMAVERNTFWRQTKVTPLGASLVCLFWGTYWHSNKLIFWDPRFQNILYNFCKNFLLRQVTSTSHGVTPLGASTCWLVLKHLLTFKWAHLLES